MYGYDKKINSSAKLLRETGLDHLPVYQSNEEYEQIFHCQLPKPSENVDQLRTDLKEYGYCYVKNAMTATQLNNLTKRIQEQADAEKEAGVAYLEGVSTFHYHKPKKGDTL